MIMIPPIADAAPLAAATEFNAGGELVRVLVSLAAIVFLIWGAGWLSRRLQHGRGGSGRRIRCVESFALGTRERIVLVEADGQRLLIGTGAGGMRTLHVYARSSAESAEPTSAPAPAATAEFPLVRPVFGELLARWKRRA